MPIDLETHFDSTCTLGEMVDGVFDEPDHEAQAGDERNDPDLERDRLRETLGFPDAIESAQPYERQGGRRGGDESASARVARLEPVDDSEMGRRLHQLTLRVEAVFGLVETLFDRLNEFGRREPVDARPTEELADIAARMVRMIELRLDSQAERIQGLLHELPTYVPSGGDGEVNYGVDVMRLSADVRALDDHLALIGRAVLDVKKTVGTLDQSPSEVQEMAIMAHIDQWFDEAQSRQATDVEHMRRDLHRLAQAVQEMYAHLSGRPEDGPPVPLIGLDESMVQLLESKLAETRDDLAEKVDQQLASRVQRFEALSQAMMTMVGDPVDSLAQRLTQLVRAQEGVPNALESIGELTQIQAQLAAAITSLRQDGVEREALLRDALRKIDRLVDSAPDGVVDE